MKFHRRLANLLGYDILQLRMHPTLESHLAFLIKKMDIDLVLDVGANFGQYAVLLRRLGYRGPIYSFEPVTSIYECLRRKSSKDKNWLCFKCGLGAAPGNQEINVTRSSHLSSFYPANNYGKKLLQEAIEVSFKEHIEVTTVDDFLKDNIKTTAPKNIFLKLDTQGYDLEVFRGALKSLKSVAGIQSEISFQPVYAGAPGYLETLRQYAAHHFRVTGFYPISRDSTNLTLIEADCVLVKDTAR